MLFLSNRAAWRDWAVILVGERRDAAVPIKIVGSAVLYQQGFVSILAGVATIQFPGSSAVRNLEIGFAS